MNAGTILPGPDGVPGAGRWMGILAGVNECEIWKDIPGMRKGGLNGRPFSNAVRVA
jgi:hypothetical protein